MTERPAPSTAGGSARGGSARAADPRLAWRPMRPYVGRARPEIRDPVIEPYWSGIRVLAHVGPLTHVDALAGPADRPVRLIAEPDVDVSEELPAIARLLAGSVDATEAVVDGIVTRQVALQGIGAAPVAEVRSSPSTILMRNTADIDIVPRGQAADPDPEEEGFVAVDLLSLDGSDLLEVPFLERKRLLESVVRESESVLRSVHVRPPIDTWIATWKALGLRGGLLKAANGRYRPGERSVEWRIVERVGRGGG